MDGGCDSGGGGFSSGGGDFSSGGGGFSAGGGDSGGGGGFSSGGGTDFGGGGFNSGGGFSSGGGTTFGGGGLNYADTGTNFGTNYSHAGPHIHGDVTNSGFDNYGGHNYGVGYVAGSHGGHIVHHGGRAQPQYGGMHGYNNRTNFGQPVPAGTTTVGNVRYVGGVGPTTVYQPTRAYKWSSYAKPAVIIIILCCLIFVIVAIIIPIWNFI